MTTSPICSNQQPAQQPPPQAPSKSPVTEATRAFYKQIREISGVLSPAQELELHLQETFTEAYTGLVHANVRAPGKSGRLDQLLAEKLGWVRWLWQNEGTTTAAGGIRQALVERSNRAADLIRTYTQFEALPTIRELDNVARDYLEPLVGATKARELLYDHIVVGQALNLRNVSDSPITANVVYQRYLAHYDRLRELDPSLETTEALDAVASKLQQTTDTLAKLARDSGVQIETLQNGGYGSLQLTPEFENYLRATNTQWLSGFGKLKEKFQKARMSNLPVVANLNELTSMLQGRLLKEPLPDRALLEYSAEELKVVEAAADVARGKAEEVRSSAGLQAIEQATKLEKGTNASRKTAVANARKLREAKAKAELTKEEVRLRSSMQQLLPGEEQKLVELARKAGDAEKAAAVRERAAKLDKQLMTQLESRKSRTAADYKRAEADVLKEGKSRVEQAKAKLKDYDAKVRDKAKQLHIEQKLKHRLELQKLEQELFADPGKYKGIERTAILHKRQLELDADLLRLLHVEKQASDAKRSVYKRRVNDVRRTVAKEQPKLLAKAKAAAEEAEAKDLASIRSKFEVERKAELKQVERLYESKTKTQEQIARKQATKTKATRKYTPEQVRSLLDMKRQELATKTEQALQVVESKWQERLDKRLDRHWAASAKATEADVAKVYASQSKEVQQLLNFERAKLTLADISTRPGELNRFLHENFSGEQLQQMFDSGLLDSLPATADELSEFYKTVDVGVRGLSDAIMLDPVAALKTYSEDLAKAASDHALFKTAFDEGSIAGWVVDEPPQGAIADYIRVGESTQLQKYLGGSGLPESAADLFIHKQAANALDSLLQINTRASNLASASSAWQTFTRPFRRMLLMSSGLGYVTRVFTQGLLATYSATGSIAQLPFAMVDALRLLDKGFKGLPSSVASFKVGGKSYTSKQLFQAMLGARGGHALASMQEPSDLLEGTFRLFDKGSRERTQHFNQLYTQKYGEPLTGTLQSVVGVAGEVFGASYRALAFSNQFLDMTFRWAVVRELASSPQWAERSFEELMRHTDNYFSINADAGSFGNFVGQALSPFAQFALNAPGAALRHALQHPWRTGNIMTMYATASGSSGLSESELPEWLKDNETYFFTMAKDPDTGKYFAVVPGSVDYMLDSYTWMAGLARDIAGIESSTAEAAARASNPFHSLQKQAAALLEKTYFYDAALALMNVDPQTLKPYELGAEADTVLGVPTTKGVRSLLTNLVPLVRTLDQSLPASVVGQAPSTKLVADGNLRITDNPGTPSWTGAVPSQGGARRNKGLPPQAAAFQALTGLSISDIDPQRNIIGSYKDLDTRLREVRSNANALYSRLAQSGSQAAPSERKRYQQLKDLELVLLRNKEAIDVQALATGQTPPVVFESLQGNFEQLVTKPLENDTLLRLLEENNR